MVRRFLRQKFGSVGMLIALAVLSIVTALQVAATGDASALESGFLALLLLAAGSVSRDASSGALQMILARPIRRVEYPHDQTVFFEHICDAGYVSAGDHHALRQLAHF